MRKIILLLSLSTIVLLFNSCDPSENNSSDTNFSENFGAAVSRDFIGQVVDADSHPIQGVTIKIGTSSVQTDINGVFIINDASVHEKFAYITAKKSGYVDGSRSMVPTSGKNNVRIMLLQDTPLQTIQSGVTSEVSIYSGTKVTFDGAFMDENGTAYSGAVAVSMFHLTPSDANIDKLMPGMLYAQTQDNKEAVLETFGMLHVELKGSNGQKLQIATGHTAQITMRIDDSQLATCPSTIPLWHFDEESGYWKQEGSATKNGNYYVGNVSHFSWWNCDAYSSTNYLTVTLVDSNGNPISNVGVSLVVNSTNFNSYIQYTDNHGQVSGYIPSNQTLTLNMHNNCGIFYSANIGPFSNNTILPNFIISNSSTVQSTIVQGTLLKCDNTSITNGYILYNNNFVPTSNGQFSFTTIYCTTNPYFTFKGVDSDLEQETDLINYNFTSPITNLGNLLTCNTVSEFITYKIDNLPIRTYTSNIRCNTNGPAGTFDSYRIERLSNDLSNVEFVLYSYSQANGIYSSNMYSISALDFAVNSNITNNVLFNLSSFGAVGQYVDVTFNGNYNDATGVQHTVNGVAHVKRDN